MKKFYILITLLLFSIAISAQDKSKISKADSLFDKGDYKKAMHEYSLSNDKNKERESSRCDSLKQKGENQYHTRQYKDAEQTFLELHKSNPLDPLAKERLLWLDMINDLRAYITSGSRTDRINLMRNYRNYEFVRVICDAEDFLKETKSFSPIKDDLEFYLKAAQYYAILNTNNITDDITRKNTEKIFLFYEYAAALGSGNALQWIANTYAMESYNSRKKHLSLLLLANEAQNDKYRKRIEKILTKYNLTVDKTVVSKSYHALTAFHDDIEAALFIHVNRENFPLEHIGYETIINKGIHDAKNGCDMPGEILFELAMATDNIADRNFLLKKSYEKGIFQALEYLGRNHIDPIYEAAWMFLSDGNHNNIEPESDPYLKEAKQTGLLNILIIPYQPIEKMPLIYK